MELRVEREELHRGERRVVHGVEQFARVADVDGGGSRGQVGGDGGLEQQTRAHHILDREPARGDLQTHEHLHPADRARHDDRAGCGARARLGANEPHHLEHPHGFTDARPRHAEFGGEGALGRKVIARPEPAVHEQGLDVREDALPGSRLRRHRCSLWSDHVVRPQ